MQILLQNDKGMNHILDPIVEAHIFDPGDIYVFLSYEDPGYDPGPLEFMYFIRREDDIMPALELEAEHYMWYKIKEYLSCTRVSESCFEFRMRCFDPEEDDDIIYSLYLHRIKTLQDAVREAYKK